MLRKVGKLQLVLFVLWGIAFISFFWSVATHRKEPLDKGAEKLPALKVYAQANSYAELDRQKATEFSLEKFASFVNYLLLAAAAVLSFTVKTGMERCSELAKAATATTPSRLELLCLLHGGIGCFFSLFCGVMAYAYLPTVGTSSTFSIYNESQICGVFQIISLLVALMSLLIGLVCVVIHLLP